MTWTCRAVNRAPSWVSDGLFCFYAFQCVIEWVVLAEGGAPVVVGERACPLYCAVGPGC
jgi:hypothetical protein